MTNEPPLLFVNGFHRSGTTVLTSAVTEAVGGVTTTVGGLARHIPTLVPMLEAGDVDRGVDRLRIAPDTAEEYGFLVRYRVGKRSIYEAPEGVTVLREHVAELAADAPGATVVLKNPWDTGAEARLLDDFPTATVILVRRRVADIERSVIRALERMATANAYPHALSGAGGEPGHRLADILASPWKRAAALTAVRAVLRRRMLRWTRRVAALPLDRVALVSYDEMRADPAHGAAWAAHLVDPAALAESFTRHAFGERADPARSGPIQDLLERRFERTWDRMRAAQTRVGVLAPPRGPATRAVAHGRLNGTDRPDAIDRAESNDRDLEER